ncbi:predicted protein [Plenodomus lingam JN3]|uniref:Predicted protein n=1 Tax=Leptosphaeria maculans (strain JN3 / isolate v23.1.3 / race Av1-4-5-6-7-8) TaxID=985895 RepID=E4ZX53_LEPMJ|nr:predicted protein [Plenodomus lingam JN3]CBX95263.1 predicted protein [Plenodomus lingam JN3]
MDTIDVIGVAPVYVINMAMQTVSPSGNIFGGWRR